MTISGSQVMTLAAKGAFPWPEGAEKVVLSYWLKSLLTLCEAQTYSQKIDTISAIRI